MMRFVRYCCVGVFNTVLGLGIILSLSFLGFSAELSNFIGYSIGIGISYVLNSIFTFKDQKGNVFKFFVCAFIAYILNFLTLCLLYQVLHINVLLSQICASAVYTISGFLLSRSIAFKK